MLWKYSDASMFASESYIASVGYSTTSSLYYVLSYRGLICNILKQIFKKNQNVEIKLQYRSI